MVKEIEAKFEKEQIDFERMNPAEREKIARRKFHAAYNYLFTCCAQLNDARARLNEIQTFNFQRTSIQSMNLYEEAELEVEIYAIAVEAAEGVALLRLDQLYEELKSIHNRSMEIRLEIESQRSGLLELIKAMKETRSHKIVQDEFDYLLMEEAEKVLE